MVHHLRAFQNGKNEGTITNLRDYTIRNELIEKLKKIKADYRWQVVAFFREVIKDGTQNEFCND
jgi:hypothetical protein